MLKVLALFVIIFSAVTSISIFAKSENDSRAANWVEIHDLGNVTGIKTYYNSNSFTTTQIKKGNYTTVEMLVSFNKPQKMVVNNKEILVSSILRSVVGECNLDIMAPVFDLYFNTKVPNSESKPIYGIEHPLNDTTELLQLSKSKIFQRYLCPTTV